MGTIKYNNVQYNSDSIKIDNKKIIIDQETILLEQPINFIKKIFKLFIRTSIKPLIEITGDVKLIATHSTINITGDLFIDNDSNLEHCDIQCATLTSQKEIHCNDIKTERVYAVSVYCNDIETNEFHVSNIVCGDLYCDNIISESIDVKGDIHCDEIESTKITIGDNLTSNDIKTTTIHVKGDISCDDIIGDVMSEGDVICSNVHGNVKTK